MRTAIKGSLELGGQAVTLTGDSAAKTLKGKFAGQTFTLKIKTRNLLSGNIGADKLELVRQVRLAIPASEMLEFDAGPPVGIQAIAALNGWAAAVRRLRTTVTPDPDGDATGPNFGKYFTEMDYARIPRRDFPKVTPAYVGDDSWGRAATPRHNNCCRRPSPDNMKTLILRPPVGLGQELHYLYGAGKLLGATNKAGQPVAIDAFGIEI